MALQIKMSLENLGCKVSIIVAHLFQRWLLQLMILNQNLTIKKINSKSIRRKKREYKLDM